MIPSKYKINYEKYLRKLKLTKNYIIKGNIGLDVIDT